MSDHKSNNSLWAIAFGLVAGGAAVYYLNTKQGREAAKNMRKDISKLEKNTRKALEQQSKLFVEKANTLANSTKNYVDDMSSIAKDKVAAFSSQAKSAMHSAQDSMEEGIDQAKDTMKNKANQAEKYVKHN